MFEPDLIEHTKNWTSSDNIDFFEKMISEKHQRWLVAVFNEKIIGHIRFVRKDNYGEIGMFYILPNFKRRGIGTQLFNAVVRDFNREIVVNVIDYNFPAIKFYQKHGFRILGKEPNSAAPLSSGKKLGLIRMKKPARSGL